MFAASSAGSSQGFISYLLRAATSAWCLSLGAPDWSGIYLSTFGKLAIFWHNVKKPPSGFRIKFKFCILAHKDLNLMSSNPFFYTILLLSETLKYLLVIFEPAAFIFTFPCLPLRSVFLTVPCSPHLLSRTTCKDACSVNCLLI